MEGFRKLTTKEKALQINLNERIYGSFAEIGAGQEVAANFFKAGGSSGTIAKTMSAYDMTFSDAIYGQSERYVSELRLVKMIEKEYSLLIKRLQKRADTTSFFAFANTVETLNYKRTNKGHGWIGMRFQLHPRTEPNDCIIHVQMKDNDNLWQQQALGLVGVNLVYACFNFSDPEDILNSLVDNLVPGRIEVDFFKISGPDFKKVDNRLLALKLVKNGLTNATMFGPDGEVLLPSEALYKKNILMLRGRFRPVTHVNINMLNSGQKQYLKDPEVDPEKVVVISELTLNNLTSDGKIDNKDFLHRVDILCSLGQTVMISNYQRYYKLVSYLSGLNKKRKIGIVLGVNNLKSIFDENYYQDLEGGILESFGILFGSNVKLYIYPNLNQDGSLNTCHDFELPNNLKSLFNYLFENNKMEDLEGVDTSLLHIVSDNVLEMIKTGQEGWESKVPEKVAKAIKENCLFDYPCLP